MNLRMWLRISVLLTLPSLALSAVAVTISGGLLIESYGLATQIRAVQTLNEKVNLLIEQSRLLSPADLGHARIEVRTFTINSQISQARDPVVFVGDSITEAALLPATICGKPVINAGIGGATPSSYAAIIKKYGLLDNLKASLIIVALGTNNAQKIAPLSEFDLNYRSLLSALSHHSAKIILAGIPPIEAKALSAYFDLSRVGKITQMIEAAAVEKNYPLISMPELMPTTDGVHLTATAYEQWNNRIIPAAKRELGCMSPATLN